MKARIASDKVIIYFAKHHSIGSLVVAKEVLKNIERLNQSAFSSMKEDDNRFVTLQRFYQTLQMLV